MDFHKIYTDFASWFVITIIGGLVTFVATLMRKVNTSETMIKQNAISHAAQIELIMSELRQKEKRRDEDRERMDRVEDDIRESRRDIQEIKNALIGKG